MPPCNMGAAHIGNPWLSHLMAATKDHVTQMMREAVPQLLVVAITSERAEVLVGVAGVPVNSVRVGPGHQAAYTSV